MATAASSLGGGTIGRSRMNGGRFNEAVSIGGIASHTLSAADRGPPTEGERTIFVSDDGLLDTGEYDQLSAEFRHRLGLLPEDDQELSEVFKVRIGLASEDRDQFDRLADEIDKAMADSEPRREETIRKNNMEQYARRYFQPGSPPVQFTQQALLRPLLPKSTDIEKRASLALWVAIKRFMDGTSQRKASNAGKGLEVPIISRVWDQLETLPVASSSSSSSSSNKVDKMTAKRRNSAGVKNSANLDTNSVSDRKNSTKRLSLKKLFRSHSSTPQPDVAAPGSASGGADVIRDPLGRTLSVISSSSSDGSGAPSQVDDAGSVTRSTSSGGISEEDNSSLLKDVVDTIPNTELDLVNYIVAHGILRKELRDEIYCQLSCQVTKNPSADSRRRGWILHSLCAGCFLPSIELCSYYYGFLYDVRVTDTLYYAAYTRRTLRRTNANGMRYHPPSSVELKALKDQKTLVVDVTVADGRQVMVEADSASTAGELCSNIATMLQIKDSFGFALFINVAGKISSLGSGLDHVMDAITECEQLARSQGRLESSASWKLYFQKELFTPWFSPSNDQASTELIFRQIINGVHLDEYKLHVDDVYTFVSRCLYVDHGRQLHLDVAKSRMADYFPKSFFANNNKSRDSVAKATMAAFESQGFSGYAVPAKFIQQEIVASASSIWPIHFSAMFEGYRVDGPVLPQNDVIIAINSGGVFLLDSTYEVLVGFHYYDLTEATSVGAVEARQATIKLVAVDGAEFTFLSPNAETIGRIITVFLDGLRRRSRWAIAIQSYRSQDVAQLSMNTGDLIEVIETLTRATSADDEEWLRGGNEKTGEKGKFPGSCIYVLPTVDKPGPDFMGLITSLVREKAGVDDVRSSRSHTTSGDQFPVVAAIDDNNVIFHDGEDEHGSESCA